MQILNQNILSLSKFAIDFCCFKKQSERLLMDQRKFKNQAHVEQQANKVIQKILSDRSYSNPQKLSLLISEYQKKQQKLDVQLSKSISNHIESVNQSQLAINQANTWMKEATEKTQVIKDLWTEQIQFHEFMEDVFTLNIYVGNLGKVIEQLSYFVDMENQLQKLQKLSEDQSKYMYVNSKLLNLIELRNALIQDSSWQRQNTLMRKQFVKVDNLEISFYDKIFSRFHDLINNCKQDQSSVINSVKVIEAYDKALQKKGKQKVMQDRAIELIKQSIDTKFMERLTGQDDLIGIIQNAKFAMTDIIDAGDYVQPCFSKEFPVMQIFQKQYKENIQKLIIPYFDQIQENNEYGNLVVLLGWIDDYETMLSRAGLDSTNLVSLKSKVKLMMPFFLDHNRGVIDQYISNCLIEDEKNYNRQFYQEAIMEGSDLVSLFPSDVFRFINQQAEIMQDKLKGQIFVEFVRCITDELNSFQKKLAEQVLQELDTIKMIDNQERIVDYEYKLILFINNYNQCLKHAGQSKQIFAQLVSEDYRSRIQKIFMNQVQKQFNSSIPRFIHGIVEIIFLKPIQQFFPMLFQSNWLTDNSRKLVNDIKNTISAQLNDIESQSLVINIIHYRMLVKEAMQFFINAYVEQLIVFIRTIYRIESYSQLKYVSESYTRKKLAQGDFDKYREVFNSKSAFSEGIKKDKHMFLKFVQSFSESTSKAFITKLTNKFVLLSDIFMKKKGQFQNLLIKVAELFPDKASQLIEVVFIVRDDVESRSSTIQKKGMGLGLSDY